MSDGDTPLRLDKWLWYARFCKSRALATKLCQSGSLRIDGALIRKPHVAVRPGQVLTFPQGRHIRVIRVSALASRRGPAAEAAELYEDLSPPASSRPLPRDTAPSPGNRPDRRARRDLRALSGKGGFK